MNVEGCHKTILHEIYYLQEYSVQVTFREQWNDERLRYYDDTNGRVLLFYSTMCSNERNNLNRPISFQVG